jgi:hypothetical protein
LSSTFFNYQLNSYDEPKKRKQDLEQLRLLSRFPQGLSRPLFDELLAAEGQTTIDVIGGK